MPVYEIEQYELHAMKYRVEAESSAVAIYRLLAGEADPVGESLEYIEVAEDFGLPAEANQTLTDELQQLNVSVPGEVIPSIRSVKVVTDL